jgi:hypothetical protein
MDLSEILDFLKTIMPWITGGVGGALLAYILNRRLAKHSQMRLSIRNTVVNYDLPVHNSLFKPIKVSYNGIEYEHISYCELEVRNASQKVIPHNPFIIIIDKDATVVDRNVSFEPIAATYSTDQQNLEPNQYRYTFGPLHPKDIIKIGLLISGNPKFEWLYRGDDVELITSDKQELIPLDKDLNVVIYLLAVYVLLDGVPFISLALKSILIIAAAPFIIRLIAKWRSLKNDRSNNNIQIEKPTDSKINIEINRKF